MILRLIRYDVLLIFSYLFLESPFAMADTPFDCRLTVNGTKFDLTTLGGEHVVNRTRQTPPTVMIDSLKFNLCAELKAQDGMSEFDQCPSGTKACLTKTNQKPNEPDRIIGVIPVAQTSTLNATYSANLAPKYISLIFHGADYPLSSSIQQTLNLTVFCNPEITSDPKFVGYDGSRLDVEWSAPAGCPFQEEGGEGGGNDKDGEEKDDSKPESVGSGIGWFILAVFMALSTYLGVGAYYNYSTYGARGYDLIPHRDFWKEVPYMLSDVVSHLCSNVRSRRTSSRGGYISV